MIRISLDADQFHTLATGKSVRCEHRSGETVEIALKEKIGRRLIERIVNDIDRQRRIDDAR